MVLCFLYLLGAILTFLVMLTAGYPGDSSGFTPLYVAWMAVIGLIAWWRKGEPARHERWLERGHRYGERTGRCPACYGTGRNNEGSSHCSFCDGTGQYDTSWIVR